MGIKIAILHKNDEMSLTLTTQEQILELKIFEQCPTTVRKMNWTSETFSEERVKYLDTFFNRINPALFFTAVCILLP